MQPVSMPLSIPPIQAQGAPAPASTPSPQFGGAFDHFKKSGEEAPEAAAPAKGGSKLKRAFVGGTLGFAASVAGGLGLMATGAGLPLGCAAIFLAPLGGLIGSIVGAKSA